MIDTSKYEEQLLTSDPEKETLLELICEVQKIWRPELKKLLEHARKVESFVYEKIFDYAWNITQAEKLTKEFKSDLVYFYPDLVGMSGEVEKKVRERLGEIPLKGDVIDTSPVIGHSSIDGKNDS